MEEHKVPLFLTLIGVFGFFMPNIDVWLALLSQFSFGQTDSICLCRRWFPIVTSLRFHYHICCCCYFHYSFVWFALSVSVSSESFLNKKSWNERNIFNFCIWLIFLLKKRSLNIHLQYKLLRNSNFLKANLFQAKFK